MCSRSECAHCYSIAVLSSLCPYCESRQCKACEKARPSTCPDKPSSGEHFARKMPLAVTRADDEHNEDSKKRTAARAGKAGVANPAAKPRLRLEGELSFPACRDFACARRVNSKLSLLHARHCTELLAMDLRPRSAAWAELEKDDKLRLISEQRSKNPRGRYSRTAVCGLCHRHIDTSLICQDLELSEEARVCVHCVQLSKH